MILTIHSPGGTRTAALPGPARLSEALALHQAPLAMPCGGRRRCRKCRVRAQGALSPVSEEERAALGEDALAQGFRLACMTTVEGDAQVTLGEGSGAQILTAGSLPEFPLEPLGKRLGMAVDIGTTTLAAYLYRLSDGVLLATATALNPQAPFGADVISRLQKSHEGQSRALAQAIRQGLNGLIGRLCETARAERGEIDAAVITGNTAMAYLLTEQPPQSIIFVPFRQDRSFGEWLPPADLELDLPGCRAVYVTRCISAYVGGDITMAAMAASLFRRTPADGPSLLADIGTNGEMVLYHDGAWYCCSTAAGPTFEGAGISMGMTARDGAVAAVEYRDGGMVSTVLGGGEAKGICGSGIIDAAAALLAAGVVDETGYLCEDGHGFEDQIADVDGRAAFRLPGTGVVLTQGDIRAVQLAKGAICAGIRTLLHQAGLDGAAVPLDIAGGFGSYLRVASAEAIGLIPPGFAARTRAIGNAAGAGASMVLLSRPMLEASEDFSRRAQTVELSESRYFMDAYPENMLFPEQE